MTIRFKTAALVSMLVFASALPALSAAQAQTAIEVPRSKEQIKLSFSPLVKRTAPAVVNIYTKRTVTGYAHPFAADPFFAPFFREDVFGGSMRKQIESALGSGVIVSSDGLVVTNAHVVRAAEAITVGLADGREFDAKLVLKDDPSDLALLRIGPVEENLPTIPLKPSESLEVGDMVLAIGNPFGVGQTVTSGIVSAQGRSSLDINDFNFFIQTDAAINPGNSGGALVDLDGRLVGINTAIYSRDGGSLGIGFAIPSEMVASVIAAADAGQSGDNAVIRPWLGVTAQNVTSDIAESLGMKRPQGALIADLNMASPLRKAVRLSPSAKGEKGREGLMVGDVILSCNGKAIQTPSEMKFRMATVPVGSKARIEIMRQGRRLEYEFEAMAPPDNPPRRQITLKGDHILKGAVIANLNPAVAVELGMDDGEQGVVIMETSSAGFAGRVVRMGDILLEINGRKINDTGDVEKALASKNVRGLSITIKRAGQIQRIMLR
ncbi:MAG: Do family serine endopeptidase [Alphaproteobacteria bacterium]|nr:Do family serine endopeptidase [Alphaproteobacteria bacterium]